MSHRSRKPPKPSNDGSLQFEPLLDSNQAAALLQIHPKTLQRMARRGEVVGVQVCKLWRFRASELDEWLARIAG